MPDPVEIVSLSSPPINIHFFKDIDALADWAMPDAEGLHRGVLIATNAEKLVKLNKEPDLFTQCQHPIYYPDGAGTLLLGSGKGKKIAGVELWLKILERADQHGLKACVFGAAPDVMEKAAVILRKRFANTELECLDGYQGEDRYTACLEQHRPALVFVALGSPRQELMIAELQKTHPDALYMGLGGSLDILTGSKKRAPDVFLKLHLEFVYRLLKEPSRLWRQTALFKFIWLVVTGRFRKAA